MLAKRRILDALTRKASKVSINQSIGQRDVEYIIQDIKNNYINQYPYLENVSFRIQRDNRFLNSSVIIEFFYGTPQEEKKIPNHDYRRQNNDYKIPNNDYRPPVYEYKVPNKSPNDNGDITDKPYVINDTGQSSFLPYLRLSNGYIFDIVTTNPRRVASILQKEMHKALENEEGINQASLASMQQGMKAIVRLTFELGMPLVQFLDHREKGQKKAAVIYSQLTHKGDLPVTIVALLAYAFLQRNVVYDTEYVKNINNHIDGNKHMTYGALVRKSAVCEGYAWGFIRIMEQIGVEAKLSTGTQNGGAHAWAIIKINNKWYNVDPTVNSNPNQIFIHNFLVSDATLIKKGYKINDKDERCIDTTYENFEIIKNDLERNKDQYIRKGANVELIKSSFYLVN